MAVRSGRKDMETALRTAGYGGRRLLARRNWNRNRHDFTPRHFCGTSGKSQGRSPRPSLACRTPRPWTSRTRRASGSRHPSAFHGICAAVARRTDDAAYSQVKTRVAAAIMATPGIAPQPPTRYESKEPRTQDIVDEVKFASMTMTHHQQVPRPATAAQGEAPFSRAGPHRWRRRRSSAWSSWPRRRAWPRSRRRKAPPSAYAA